MLRQAQRHRQDRMQQAEERACEGGDQNPSPETGAQPDSHPAAHRPDDKNTFDAKVQDTGTFADECAQHTKNQRRGNTQTGGPEALADQDIQKVGHEAAFPVVARTIR